MRHHHLDSADNEGCFHIIGLLRSDHPFTTREPEEVQGLRAPESIPGTATEQNNDGKDDDDRPVRVSSEAAAALALEVGKAALSGAVSTGVGMGITAFASAGAAEAAVVATGAAAGIGAGAVAAAVVAPAAAVAGAVPLALGAFRVRSDVILDVGGGVGLVEGAHHFGSGSFGSAFPLRDELSAEHTPEGVSSFVAAQRERAEGENLLSAEFPAAVSEGTVCLQYYNAWGSACGCNGMISYRIEGTDKFLVCVLGNPYDRNLSNPCCAIGITDFRVKCDEAQVNSLFAVAKEKLCGFGFAGLDFSAGTAGGFVSVGDGRFRGEGRMTSSRISTAYFSLVRESACGPPTPAMAMAGAAARSARLRDAIAAGNLAAALTIGMEVASAVTGGLPPGRLTYLNGGGGCARTMVVTFLDNQGVVREMASDKTHTLTLPAGATMVKVTFQVQGGGKVRQVDRRHPNQPWVRTSSGNYPMEVLDFDRGDGIDAVFLVCGTSLHSYVHKAWDFGRDLSVPPRDWEWRGGTNDAIATVTRLAEDKGRSPGRLTYKNGGGGCARTMMVSFIDDQNVCREIMSDKSHIVILPEGATMVKVRFKVNGGGIVRQIDRKHPKQPWVRSSSGEYPVEVLDFDHGDGVDAVFLVCGTSFHSYVHKAWDFRRAPFVQPRSWEWWGSGDEDELADTMSDPSHIRARLRVFQNMKEEGGPD